MGGCSRARQPERRPRGSRDCPSSARGRSQNGWGKKGVAPAGSGVPAGDRARTVDEAAAVARHIGYPVVLKAQAAALSHKTEAGGVMLSLADEEALRGAWDTLMTNIK